MGARIYNPTIGRFLTIDPVEGGNADDYTYPNDAINFVDLSGLRAIRRRTTRSPRRPLDARCECGGFGGFENGGNAGGAAEGSSGEVGDGVESNPEVEAPTEINNEGLHAWAQIERKGIDRSEVEYTVNTYRGEKQIDYGGRPGITWKYTGSRVTVILNDRAVIVTAFKTGRNLIW